MRCYGISCVVYKTTTILDISDIPRACKPHQRRFHAITKVLTRHRPGIRIDKLNILNRDIKTRTRTTTLQTPHHVRQRTPLPITQRHAMDVKLRGVAIPALTLIVRALHDLEHASRGVEIETREREIRDET